MKKLLTLAICSIISYSSFATVTPKPTETNKFIYLVKTKGIYLPGSGGNGHAPICLSNDLSICVLIRVEVPDVWNPLNISYAEYYNPDSDTYVPISGLTRTNLANGNYQLNFTLGPVWQGPFGLLPTQYTVTP